MRTGRRPGNPGLKGKLLNKSIEAYVLALETINRLSVTYRVETFAYLICNAWELLLKAKILEDSRQKRAIYYPRQRGERPRTLALRDCLKKVFPSEVIADVDRREALLIALRHKHDEAWRAAIGLRGEEFVVDYARTELIELGRDDLAGRVRRLSEFSDDLGYDVVAPRFNGIRRLEVKTSVRDAPGLFHFFISRSEFEWGLSDMDWAVVACRLLPSEEVQLVGWCRAGALEPYLPSDGEGKWASAELDIPETLLGLGLPPTI